VGTVGIVGAVNERIFILRDPVLFAQGKFAIYVIDTTNFIVIIS